LISVFGMGIGTPGYDIQADFTGDGWVDLRDFNLLRSRRE
jgi:hypothetical protein